MKSLPNKPNLEFLKKQAKALRALHKQGDSACCAEIRLYDLSFKSKSDSEILAARFSINDAQRIVARQHGYASWTTLKEYVNSLDSPLYHRVADKETYQSLVAESYDKRAPIYDNHVWAREWCMQLVDFCPPRVGENILDIGCGSGTIAFHIAGTVGAEGYITGVDIAPGMIVRCKEKLKERHFSNLKFEYGDAEQLVYPTNIFDRIYASAILPWLINPQAALRHWFERLKPLGWIGLTAWPGNSFVWGDGQRRALRKYGIDSTVHEFSATKAKTRKLMELAGFSNITLYVVERGRWMEPESLKGPFHKGTYAAAQYPHPLENVPDEILLQAQKDFEAAVDRLTTEEGVWHDMTTYFVCAQKPEH
jgi:ubiquinone/menaquinone biosynthesis C-methylase UbiE